MIDQYLAELARGLHLRGRRRARVLAEVRDHLDDAIARLEAAGIDRSTAHEQATSAFGRPAELARQFNLEAATAAMRRTPLLIGAAAATVLGGFLLAATTQPQPAVPVSAGFAVQVLYFAAVLSMQVAMVAGMCAASRVAARWRSATRGEDRGVVRRGAVICVAGLTAAAASWSVVLELAARRLPNMHVVTLLAGGALMLAGALAGVAVIKRLPGPQADDGDGIVAARNAGVLGVGELVIGAVRRWPVATCAIVATVAALMAMSAAETTVVGALPSGLAEMAAVVAGFVFLGPALGLREPLPRDDSSVAAADG